MHPRIFISYRRADSEATAGRIYDHLVASLGRENIFQDVMSMPPGVNFSEYITAQVIACNILLVIIGKQWITVTNESGQQRLNNPHDFVRIEVEAGLNRPQMLVIPVLVDNASMPGEIDLPDSLKNLHLRNAIRVRPNPDFNHDMDRLIEAIVIQNNYIPRKVSFRRINTRIRVITSTVIFLMVALLIYYIYDVRSHTKTDLQPTLTLQTEVPSTTLAATPIKNEITEIYVTDDPIQNSQYTVKTDRAFINVYLGPNTNNQNVGVLVNGDVIKLLTDKPATTEGWVYIQHGDITGWVNSTLLDNLPECAYVADGFDVPVGTDSERQSSSAIPKGWRIAQTFGSRNHTGIDLDPPGDEKFNAPVYASGSGIVVVAENITQHDLGNVVVVQHDPLYDCTGPVFYSRYAFLDNILVSVGGRVERGQQIATVGHNETGYFLHFDVSPSKGVALFPDYWPTDDPSDVFENFVDPQAFITKHRPPIS